MSLEITRSFLMWCTIINYGILLVWFLAILIGHDAIYRLHGRWFQMSRERFDAIHYTSIAVFKIGVILFNLTPLVALTIVG